MQRRAPNTRTEIRQKQIAEAALRLVARRGLHGLNLGALAKAVDVVPSAIYRHFPGKNGVLGAVLDSISEQLLANVLAVRQATPDALGRLQLLLDRHVELVRLNAGVPRVLFAEQIFAGHPTRRRKVYRILQGYLREIASIIREGQGRRRIRKDINPDTAALMFLGLVQPAVILWLTSQGTFDVARHIRQAWRLFGELLRDSGPYPAKESNLPEDKPIKRATINKHNNHK